MKMSVDNLCNNNDKKSEALGRKHVSVLLCSTQIPSEILWNPNWASGLPQI